MFEGKNEGAEREEYEKHVNNTNGIRLEGYTPFYPWPADYYVRRFCPCERNYCPCCGRALHAPYQPYVTPHITWISASTNCR